MKKKLPEKGLFALLKMMELADKIPKLKEAEQNGQLWFTPTIHHATYHFEQKDRSYSIVVEVEVRYHHSPSPGEQDNNGDYSRKKTYRQEIKF